MVAVFTSTHMTTLTVTSVTKDSPGAGQVTIIASYADASFNLPAQRKTIGEVPTANPNWSRIHQITDQAYTVGRNGANPVAIYVPSMAIIAYAMEPTLTFVPVVNTQPSSASCVHSSTAATFTVVATSEPSFSYQWQYWIPTDTLTSDNTAPADGSTVTIGGVTYTWKTALTPSAGQVLINGTADAALLNLIRAINHSGTAGTDYANSGTTAVANPLVSAATSVTSHSFAVTPLVSTGTTIAATQAGTSHCTWGTSTVGWTNASGTVNGCAYTNGTTATLTCTPTTTGQTGVLHRCALANSAGTRYTSSVTLTIT